jgi:hypothetical protein
MGWRATVWFPVGISRGTDSYFRDRLQFLRAEFVIFRSSPYRCIPNLWYFDQAPTAAYQICDISIKPLPLLTKFVIFRSSPYRCLPNVFWLTIRQSVFRLSLQGLRHWHRLKMKRNLNQTPLPKTECHIKGAWLRFLSSDVRVVQRLKIQVFCDVTHHRLPVLMEGGG